MPLTTIPEKTEDSLGIVKQDALPYTDPNTQVPAVQYERLKDAVIANALAIGLGDGTTPDSIIAQLADLETPTLQVAYEAGSVIDTTAGSPVTFKTATAELTVTGNAIAAADSLTLSASAKDPTGIDLHATHPEGALRLLVDSQVRLLLKSDGVTYRFEPGADLGASLGSTSRRYAEGHVGTLRTESITKDTSNQALALIGGVTIGTSAAAIRVSNGGDFSASAGEQRLLEVYAKNGQTGTASLVAADVLVEGTKGTILRARSTTGGEVLNVDIGQARVIGLSPAGDPGLGFIGDSSTGICLVGPAQLGLVSGKAVRVTVENSRLVSTVPIRAAAGTASAPTFSFASDIDTGVYQPATNQLGLVAGADEVLRLESGVVRAYGELELAAAVGTPLSGTVRAGVPGSIGRPPFFATTDAFGEKLFGTSHLDRIYSRLVVTPTTWTAEGVAFGSSGTLVVGTRATTNYATASLRLELTTAATANTAAEVHTTSAYLFRGGATTRGGFLVHARFGIGSNFVAASTRFFVGLNASTAALPGATNPDTLNANFAGVGFNAAGTVMKVYYNDAGGAPSVVSTGITIAANDVYDVWLWVAPNSTVLNYRINRVSGVAGTAAGTMPSFPPADGTMMGMHAWVATTTNSARTLSVMRLVSESIQ